MVPRENKNTTYAKFWKTNKEYYGIFESGLYYYLNRKSSSQTGALSIFDSHHIFFPTLILKQKLSHINIGKGKAKYCLIAVNKNMYQP